jgi:1,4-alpha-glucan branching enzyme
MRAPNVLPIALLLTALLSTLACVEPTAEPEPEPGGGTGGDGSPGALTPSPLGATIGPGGVTFRVWAKAAKAVAVQGDFATPPGTTQVSMTRLEPAGLGVWAVKVSGVQVGARYRYLITAPDGSALQRLDPYGRQVKDGQSVVVDPLAYAWTSAPYVRPGKNQLVVYELHVGSFNCPEDPNRCGFAKVAERLDYLQSLGVNVIELMPAHSHGSQRGWGYNPHSYFAPHAPYGTPDELRALVDGAHSRGIAVVLDMVYNHYDGWKKAPLYCFDGDCEGGWSGAYFFADPKYRSTPWGPRFDYTRPQVADFIVDNVAFYRREYRIDGFRWDSVSNIRAIDGTGSVPGGVALLRRANAQAQSERGALLIAEDLKGYAGITEKSDSGGLGFDTQWDGGFHYALTSLVSGADDRARNIAGLRDALGGRYNGDPFQRLIYSESHDTVGNSGTRLPSQIDGNDPGSWAARKRSILAAGVLLTAPGVPMLFAGQEFLSVGRFADPPAPLDWSRTMGHARIVDFYRDLIALRRNREGTTAGLTGSDITVTHQNDAAKVLVYRRSAGADTDVMVICNFGSQNYTRYDIGLPAPGTWKVRLNSDDRRYSTDFGGAPSTDVVATAMARDGLPYTGGVALGPYSLVILSR